MKDYIEQFEELNERVEKLLEAGFWKRLKNRLMPTSDFSREEKAKGINRKYAGSDIAKNYRDLIDSGEECAPGVSNGRFYSEPGTDRAVFYSVLNDKITPTGFVENIKPFIDNAGISKKILRCYNISKDPLKIGWLFNGSFKASMLDWDKKKKKVIFHGDWKGGGGAVFGGILQGAEEKAVNSPLLKQYKIVKNGQETGPFTAGDIMKLLSKNKITMNTVIRPLDSTDFEYVKDDKTLSYLLKSLNTSVKPVRTTKPTVGFGAKQNPAGQL